MNRRVPPPVTTNGPMPMDEAKRIQIAPLFLPKDTFDLRKVFGEPKLLKIQYIPLPGCWSISYCSVWIHSIPCWFLLLLCLGFRVFKVVVFSYPLGMIPANIFLSWWNHHPGIGLVKPMSFLQSFPPANSRHQLDICLWFPIPCAL